jgi:hypothetical protein
VCTHLKAILQWPVSILLPAEEGKKAKWIAFSMLLGLRSCGEVGGFGDSVRVVLRCMVGFAD